jgi:hypothetical protein
MSFRNVEQDLGSRLEDIERRLRALEQPGALPPDRGWVLTQVGTDLHYLYVPTDTLGPVIGSQ